MSKASRPSFSTRAVHAGERPSPPDFSPVATPIYPSVSYLYDDMQDLDGVLGATQPGFVYTRYGNPTVAAFEAAMAELESGEAAFAFASGMAAMHTSLLAAGVRAGSVVVGALDLYGATHSLLHRLFSSLGVHVRTVDVCELRAVESALAESSPVALVAETISNPLVKVADIPALAALAHRYEAQLLVDNTFASPYLYQPLADGADYSIHSATKYIAGHGDVTAGIVITSRENRSKLYELNKLVGGLLGPFEAWLALRGLKTIGLRVGRQCENAARIAAWLSDRPGIARVNYPGLPTHPQHELANRQFGGRGAGGVLSFEIAGAGKAEIFRFMEALRLCLPATSLGDIYSLVLYPVMSSHRALSPQERAKAGIGEGLVRLSAGIEDAGDIRADLEQALASIGRA